MQEVQVKHFRINKLTGLAVLFSLGALGVGSFGAYTIHQLGDQTQALVGSAVVRVNAASAGATALVAMDRSLQQLIAAAQISRVAAVRGVRPDPLAGPRAAAPW